ncbi:MAG: hypothetical protein ACTHNS_01485 [Marmoricola sp.]
MNDTEQVPGASEQWTPHFPHARIDSLLAQLRAARGGSAADVQELLVLIAEEGERVRRTVYRLAAARLEEAEREADRIVRDAARTAHELRTLGTDALEARLDECERLTRAVRELVRITAAAADQADHAGSGDSTPLPPRPPLGLVQDPTPPA